MHGSEYCCQKAMCRIVYYKNMLPWTVKLVIIEHADQSFGKTL